MRRSTRNLDILYYGVRTIWPLMSPRWKSWLLTYGTAGVNTILFLKMGLVLKWLIVSSSSATISPATQWSHYIDVMIKKVHWHIYFLRCLRIFIMSMMWRWTGRKEVMNWTVFTLSACSDGQEQGSCHTRLQCTPVEVKRILLGMANLPRCLRKYIDW